MFLLVPQKKYKKGLTYRSHSFHSSKFQLSHCFTLIGPVNLNCTAQPGFLYFLFNGRSLLTFFLFDKKISICLISDVFENESYHRHFLKVYPLLLKPKVSVRIFCHHKIRLFIVIWKKGIFLVYIELWFSFIIDFLINKELWYDQKWDN